MQEEMDKIDMVFLKEEKQNKSESMNKKASFVNHADHLGRTALHVAVICNNKVAVETLLYLGANPHLTDCFDQRPLDICYGEGLVQLLENKMHNFKLQEEKETIGKMSMLDQLKLKTGNANISEAKDKKFSLEIKDIVQVPKEKVVSARIGSEGDTYLQYAIKHQRLDLVKFLLRKVPEINITAKNNKGMTALHQAIRSDQIQFVKCLFIGDHKNEEQVDQLLKSEKSDDLKPLMQTQKVVPMLSAQNLRGMTPLISCVDHGNYGIFRMVFEIYLHVHQVQKKHAILTKTFVIQDTEKKETALMRAVRQSRLEMVYSMLHLVGPDQPLDSLSYLTQTDGAGKNILHYAIINKQKDLIERLITTFDTDQQSLRKQKDAKGKTPQAYDEQTQFSSLFITQWDAAATGQNIRLTKMLQADEASKSKVSIVCQPTFWLRNTCLHMACKNGQLETIKMLMEVGRGKKLHEIKNAKGQTPFDIAKASVKDKEMLNTIEGLLRGSKSTKVVRNADIKLNKFKDEQSKIETITRLREKLKAALSQAKVSLGQFFMKFDKNGDGKFSPLEFETAFTCLEIDFSKAELRQFLRLTDTNKDGFVDYLEFKDMLDGKNEQENIKQALRDEVDVIDSDDSYEEDEVSPVKSSFVRKEEVNAKPAQKQAAPTQKSTFALDDDDDEYSDDQ